MQESDYERIAFFSDGNVYGMIVGERLAKLQSKKKTQRQVQELWVEDMGIIIDEWIYQDLRESGLEQGGQLIEKWVWVKGSSETEKVRWFGDMRF